VTSADVLDRVCTTVNPVTGSEPPVAAWAVFGNDTFFLTAPADELPEDSTHDEIREVALRALRELGPSSPAPRRPTSSAVGSTTSSRTRRSG
jgi:hypothetical protein